MDHHAFDRIGAGGVRRCLAPALLVVACLAAPTTRAAETYIGSPDCRVVNPKPADDESVTWSGSCKDGFAEGEGKLTWFLQGKETSFFEGTMRRGRPEGDGYYKYRSGTQEEGVFENGLLRRGIRVDAIGTRHEGSFVDGRLEGQGRMTTALGGSYTGNWKAGRMQGGTATTPYGRQIAGFAQADAGEDTQPDGERKTYNMWDRSGPGGMAQAVALGSTVPMGKSWEELSPEERSRVRLWYPLPEEDEPPYPVAGLGRFHLVIARLRQKVDGQGPLALVVDVDATGQVSGVQVRAAPTPELGQYAAMIAAKVPFKPARCDGKPCAMKFAYCIILE